MKVLFHVGPHKTGTTSLQHFLWANADKLSEQGFFVPRIQTIDNSSNPWYLVYIACANDERAASYHNTKRGGHSAEQCRKFKEHYEIALRASLAKCKELEETLGRETTFIISTEEIAHLNQDENNTLYALFLEYARSVEVLYYYRSPIERLRSDAQQGSKGGNVLRPQTFQNLPCQDTARTRKLYPRVRIAVRPYLRGVDGNRTWDVRLDFCQIMRINPEELAIPAKDPGANESISLQMFSILQWANAAMPSFKKDGNFNEYKRHFHDAVDAYVWTPEDTPFYFSRDDIDSLLWNRGELEKFLDLGRQDDFIDIHPDCQKVFDSMATVKIAEGVEGSIFDYTPTMSHQYYVNAICHFWSYLHRARARASKPALRFRQTESKHE
jgi:hypothetical protein